MKLIENTLQIFRVGKWFDQFARFAEAAHVIANDSVVLRKCVELRVPHSPVHLPTVNEDQGGAFAFGFIPNAIDGGSES
jgi:hypothetical protein